MIPLLLVISPLVQLAEAQAASINTTLECPACDATACSYRSVWSILATCALTMLVCVWNATYPNIVPTKRWYTATLYRGVLGLVTLLSPELTTSRAVLEWRYAGKIREDFQNDQWTRTHGFFALMGGFVVQDGAQEKTLRTRGDLRYLRNGTIVHPEITRRQIIDRSKSDGLGNALLVLQLSWFILQVVARAANHLAITLLEIDTLALAVLSLPLFYFWWSKPMAAAYPHVFYLSDVPETSSSQDGDGRTPLLKVHDITVSPKRDWWDEMIGMGLDDEHDGDEDHRVLALMIVWIIFVRTAPSRVGLPIPKSSRENNLACRILYFDRCSMHLLPCCFDRLQISRCRCDTIAGCLHACSWCGDSCRPVGRDARESSRPPCDRLSNRVLDSLRPPLIASCYPTLSPARAAQCIGIVLCIFVLFLSYTLPHVVHTTYDWFIRRTT